MADLHSRIIAAAAKPALTPLGFRRRGQSRLWLADRGSWLNVVEFTPSQWSKSTSLRNAAHWLWIGAGFTSFNVSIPSTCHAVYETEEQFRTAVAEVASEARSNAQSLDEQFPSFEAVAAFVVDRALSSPDRSGPSWWGLQAGIATGLLGRCDEAERFLRGVTDERVVARAADLLPLVGDAVAFRTKVNGTVALERQRLKLPPLDSPPF